MPQGNELLKQVDDKLQGPSLPSTVPFKSRSNPAQASSVVDNINPTRMDSLSRSFIRHDAITYFADNCTKALDNWISLLRKTTLPQNITSSDISITTAFRSLDYIISGTKTTSFLSRFTHVQLIRVFENIESIITRKRQNGLLHPARGIRDASIAISISLRSWESFPNKKWLRRKLHRCKRIGKRWRELSKPSPFFLLIYSDAAEKLVYVAPILSFFF